MPNEMKGQLKEEEGEKINSVALVVIIFVLSQNM
jgi:hypothetical protein